MPITSVDLAVRDLDRSEAFYRDLLDLRPVPVVDAEPARARWLSAGPAVLRLHEVGGGDSPSGWLADDLQRGFRHVGFKVSDLDERAQRVRDAGARFHKDPKDVPGAVRITFFFDPDGTLLEFVQNPLRYDEVLDPASVAVEQARPAPTTPRFDHVAVTVGDPAAASARYASSYGLTPAGRLRRDDDPRGFRIDYLHGGETVLELFSWGIPTLAPATLGPDRTGFRGVGMTSPAAAPGQGEPDADGLVVTVEPPS